MCLFVFLVVMFRVHLFKCLFVCLFYTLFHLPFVYLFVYLLYVVVDCFCFGGRFTLYDSFVVFVGFSCLSCVFVCVLQLMVYCDCFLTGIY